MTKKYDQEFKNKDTFGLRWLFRHFNIAPNAYYNYLKDNKDGYRKQKQKIFEEIKSIYYNDYRIPGHRGMKIFLARKGINLSNTTVHRYMNRELNLHAVTMRKKQTYVHGQKIKYGVLISHISGYPMGKCGTTTRLLIYMTVVQ